MIADDTDAIRNAMRKIAQDRVQAQAEAARKAEKDDTAVNMPTPKPLFSESAPPFRGFAMGNQTMSLNSAKSVTVFVSPGDHIEPNFFTAFDLKMRSLAAKMAKDIPHGVLTQDQYPQTFDPNRYAAAVDEWDHVTLDSGVTAPNSDHQSSPVWRKPVD